MKIGLMQGRLLPPVNNHIQEFPHKNWQKEFDYMERLDLIGVEWLVTKNSFPDNPVFQKDVYNEYPIISVCLDVLVDEKIHNQKYVLNVLNIACETVDRVTVPILDESDMSDKNKRKKFCDLMDEVGDKFSHVQFSFESEMPARKLNEIVCLRENFKVTYDTGNITSSNINHEEYIDFFADKISNVHLKDRTMDRQTVEPTTGDTDFKSIFKKLKQSGYDGNFVIQTARFSNEFETIKRHKKIFEELYEAV